MCFPIPIQPCPCWLLLPASCGMHLFTKKGINWQQKDPPLIIHAYNITISVTDPDPGPGAFLTQGSVNHLDPRSGSGMNIPDHISESLETVFVGGLKIPLNSHCDWFLISGSLKNQSMTTWIPVAFCNTGGLWGDASSGCGSVIVIPDPDFYPTRNLGLGWQIPDLTTAKDEGEKTCFLTFFF